jgi:hypothetical protein
MATLLATKATQEVALATDDEAHEQLVTDPTVAQFSSGDTTMASTSTGFGGGFGNASANISSSGTSTFGSASTGGFGSSSSVGSTTPTSSGFSGGGFGSSSSSAPAGAQPALTGAGSNAAQGADVLVANDNTDWINKKWRPVMGWMYMVVCVCDFTVFPILWSLLQAISHGQVTSQWQPVTLQGAGLFHVAMGAVLGIAAYGRTKEKVAGAA